MGRIFQDRFSNVHLTAEIGNKITASSSDSPMVDEDLWFIRSTSLDQGSCGHPIGEQVIRVSVSAPTILTECVLEKAKSTFSLEISPFSAPVGRLF
jgi:hypothetical protein